MPQSDIDVPEPEDVSDHPTTPEKAAESISEPLSVPDSAPVLKTPEVPTRRYPMRERKAPDKLNL